jgi:hypothetical protein
LALLVFPVPGGPKTSTAPGASPIPIYPFLDDTVSQRRSESQWVRHVFPTPTDLWNCCAEAIEDGIGEQILEAVLYKRPQTKSYDYLVHSVPVGFEIALALIQMMFDGLQCQRRCRSEVIQMRSKGLHAEIEKVQKRRVSMREWIPYL